MNNILAHLNCYQSCLYSICSKYGLADYLMFSGSWKFVYDNNKPFSNSLSLPLDDKGILLDRFQGLEITVAPFDNPAALDQLLLATRQNDTNIIINVDSFECPWHKAYNKLSIPHCVQVINADTENQKLFCNDPYLNVFNQVLPFENLLNGCKSIRLLGKKDIWNNIDVGIVLRFIRERTKITQISEGIVSFAQSMKEVISPDELFDYTDDIYLCSNIRNLKFIADSRYGLSYLFSNLYLLESNNSLLLEIAKRFNYAESLYKKINSYYIKLYYRSNDLGIKIGYMIEKLMEIVNIEKEINELLEYMG